MLLLIRDRRSGLVFSDDELRAALPGSMPESLSLSQSMHWTNAAELLANGPLINASSIVIPAGNPDREALNNLASVLQNPTRETIDCEQ